MDPRGEFVATILRKAPRAYALGAVARMQERCPDLVQAATADGRSDPTEDTRLRILHLVEAVATGVSGLLVHEVEWQRGALNARDIPDEYLRCNLQCLLEELLESLPENQSDVVEAPLRAGLEALARPKAAAPSLLEDSAPLIDVARRFLLALLEGRSNDAVREVNAAMDDGAEAKDIHEHVLSRVQREVGRMWQMGELHIAEEHLGSRIVERVLGVIRERSERAKPIGKRALTASVAGNFHDIGLRMVADQLEIAGWDVMHVGANLPHKDAVQAAIDFEVHLVAIAATLVPHLGATAELISQLRADPQTARLPILVGGTPFGIAGDLHLAVGADAAALSATDAVKRANELTA